jgi:Ca2+-binding RTX toxin-like protein
MAVFVGTDANDSYLSTSAGDNARGARGDDTLIGGAGQDTLNGNADSDLLRADSATQTAGGNDSLFGGQGNDTLLGAQFGFSSDSLGGNRGEDLLIASTNGGNTLFGGQGDDTIYGSLSNGNTMNGDIGNDVLIAGRGNDRMLGGEGNDTLIGGTGNNDMFGGVGNDQFQFFTAIDGDVSVLTGPEQVIRARGGFGGSDIINDFATGDTISISQLDRNATVSITTNAAGAAVIAITGTASNGQPTNNQTITVVGVTRDQLLAPGAQLFAVNGSFITTNNTVNDGAGSSVFTVGDGQPGANIKGKSLVGSPVADSFSDNSAIATSANGILLQTTVNDDITSGGAGDDYMFGSAGNDILSGGDSSLDPLGGDLPPNTAPGVGDTLIGGTGFDTLTGDGGTDNFVLDIFQPGVIDTIADYKPITEFDKILISAAGFGGSLVPGQTASGAAPTQFQAATGAGGVEGLNSTVAGLTTIGTSAFYYDKAGGGLYFDRDGAGTGTLFTKVAQITPLLSNLLTIAQLVIVA